MFSSHEHTGPELVVALRYEFEEGEEEGDSIVFKFSAETGTDNTDIREQKKGSNILIRSHLISETQKCYITSH